MRDYKDVISANDKAWRSEARRLLVRKVEFVVVHLKPEDFSDCRGLAQEFDYDCCLEDASPWREEIISEFPVKLPTAIGFVKRSSLQTKINPN